MSEVLLHRTRAEQVVPVYSRFIKRFPTPERLALSHPNQIRDITRSLGLFWRTDLLREMAERIQEHHNGKIPTSREELEELPGVGSYIAGAVGTFAYNRPEAILDTNTVRILSRVFHRRISDTSRRSKEFAELYSSLIDPNDPRRFNYAMIDLAAIICKSRVPLCSECPVLEHCAYGSAVASRKNG